MRLTLPLRTFRSGVGWPDVAVWGPEVLTQGVDAMRAAGYWGPAWGMEGADLVLPW